MAGRRWKEIASILARLLAEFREEPARAVHEAIAASLGNALSRLDLGSLLRAVQLAAQYERPEVALALIEDHRRAAGFPEGAAASAYAAIRLAADLAAKDYPAVEGGLRSLDWASVPDADWAFNLRLLVAAWQNRHDDVLSLLATGRRFREPYERGNCLRILGKHFLSRGRWDRSLGYFRAAMKEYARDGAVDSRLKEIEILAIHGSAACQEGRFEEAEGFLGRAVRLARRWRHSFYEDSCRLEIAQAHSYREEHARAETIILSVIDDVRRRGGRAPLDGHLLTAALIAAAGAAADRGRIDEARRRAGEAGARLDAAEHPRLRGYWRLIRARLRLADAGADAGAGRATDACEAAWREALAELEAGEQCFRSIGDGDRLGLSRAALQKGQLHLERRDLGAALAEAVKCMEIAKAARLLPIQARCLLLESQLLLQEKAPDADRLYEEVLSSLGAIHDPVILFKVIANLYIHTWELDHQLDLTDYHLRQIHGMKDLLERKTFADLYERHVTRRVARRVLIKSFGVDPGLLPDDGD